VDKIRVFHADDHVAFSNKLREILAPEVEWVGAVYDADAVVSKVTELAPDVVLLDITMPGKSGLELARELSESMPELRIVFVTVHREPAYVEAAFNAGASGYVLKNAVASEVSTAVREVHAGRTFVSSSVAGRGPGGLSAAN
jgi:DNA-binding NarL/FixJ family response regulator